MSKLKMRVLHRRTTEAFRRKWLVSVPVCSANICSHEKSNFNQV